MQLVFSLILAGFALSAEPDCYEQLARYPEFNQYIAPLLDGRSPELVKRHPWLLGLIQHRETCPTNWNQLGCAHPVENFETLETPESGLQAKVEMLLGQKLPPDFIKNGDPHAPLDFSKAPKLKGVYLASLVYRSDFYGTLIARLLKHHADRGTLVNVVTTDYMMLDKDRALLEPLAAQNPNIRLDKFKYKNPGGLTAKATNLITDKFRDMHIKLFITLSDENEANNAIVFGGRNIHDGFLYAEKPDHTKHPELVQYGKDDNFVHWNDFEAKITSKELAESTAAQLEGFFGRNRATQAMRPFTEHAPGAAPAPKNAFRHFISVPYADDHALEKQYIEMIDAAKSSIKFSSPYLRPTPKLTAALQRAAKRGVDITIQTRVELTGDTQAWLYEEVNKESINKLYKDAKIYKWKENSILHSKFLLVDSKAAMIGSVNMSRRSFIQDVENGFVIENEAVTQKMEKIFDGYVAKSELIEKPLPRKTLPSVMIRILENQF